MIKYFVYGFYVVDHRLPFYIGKSSDKFGLNHRLRGHTVAKNSNSSIPLYVYIRELESKGISWYRRIIKYYDTQVEVFELESKLIKLIGRKDLGLGPLLNLKGGGQGVTLSITEEERLEVLEMKDLYDKGMSTRKLAKMFFINQKTVVSRLKTVNTKFRSSIERNIARLPKTLEEKISYYGWDINQLEEIKRLYIEEEKPMDDIEKLLNIDRSSVDSRLVAMGISIRTQSEAAKLRSKNKPETFGYLKNVVWTEERRKKASLSKKGKPSVLLGRHLSEETKNKISLSKIGKSSKLKGRPKSEEHKRHLSESKKGKKLSVKRVCTKKRSEETNKKVSNSLKAIFRSRNINVWNEDLLERIKYLYVEEGYSSVQIAKIINISNTMVRSRLIECGVKLRDRQTVEKLKNMTFNFSI